MTLTAMEWITVIVGLLSGGAGVVVAFTAMRLRIAEASSEAGKLRESLERCAAEVTAAIKTEAETRRQDIAELRAEMALNARETRADIKALLGRQ